MGKKKIKTQNYQEYVASGQYFNDAKKWYTSMYIAPFVQRSWLFVACILTLCFLSVTIYNIAHILPIEEKVPYILEVDNAVSQSAAIEPLTQSEEDAWIAVANFLVKDYVTIRESYRFRDYRGERLTARKQRIRKSSSKNIYQEYESFTNNTNPRAPIRLYRDSSVRLINFNNVTITRLDETSATADIRFSAEVRNVKTGESTVTRWNAELYFQLPVIDPEAQKGVTLNFLVTSYKITPVS